VRHPTAATEISAAVARSTARTVAGAGSTARLPIALRIVAAYRTTKTDCPWTSPRIRLTATDYTAAPTIVPWMPGSTRPRPRPRSPAARLRTTSAALEGGTRCSLRDFITPYRPESAKVPSLPPPTVDALPAGSACRTLAFSPVWPLDVPACGAAGVVVEDSAGDRVPRVSPAGCRWLNRNHVGPLAHGQTLQARVEGATA